MAGARHGTWLEGPGPAGRARSALADERESREEETTLDAA
jgi:hypothetical protein